MSFQFFDFPGGVKIPNLTVFFYDVGGKL